MIDFKVLDPYPTEPGTYMFKDGGWMPYDGSDVSNILQIEHKKVSILPLNQLAKVLHSSASDLLCQQQ